MPEHAVRFAVQVDDLDAREALRRAGSLLIGEFHAAAVDGQLVQFVQEVVPPAFAEVVNPLMAGMFFAAASALIARLAANALVACVAEEILVVRLMEMAEGLLEEELGLRGTRLRSAVDSLDGLWDFCGDSDVLMLFQMTDPADAAVAGHGEVYEVMGVVDQRPEAWFQPFSWAVPTGHLDEPEG